MHVCIYDCEYIDHFVLLSITQQPYLVLTQNFSFGLATCTKFSLLGDHAHSQS